MKHLTRMFALLLAACMLLTSLGVSAWADNPLPPDEQTSPPATEPVDGGEGETPEDGVLTLPASLKTIEAQAFYGDTSLGKVVLPEGLEAIGAQAFAQSSLAEINLPASLGANAIADDAFDGVENLTVTAAAGTAAYAWAVDKGLIVPTVPIDEATFPDETFRTYVSYMCDEDGDGELSPEEIAAVKEISLSWSGVQSLQGLAVFTELEYLECNNTGAQGGTPLEALDVSANTKLKTLICENNALKTLNLRNNGALERLICIGNQLTSLDVSQNEQLVELRCGANPSLTALDLSNNRALQKLYCRNCDLDGLTLTNNAALKVLSCDGNADLGVLSLDTNLLLEELSCAGCGLNALDLSLNARLIQLDCSNNAIGSLNVANNRELVSLHCAGCGLSALDVTNNTALSSLRCGNNAALTALTLHNMTDLTELHCEDTGITSLDITSCDTLLICWRLGTVETADGADVYFYAGGHTSKGYIRMLVPAGADVIGSEPTGSGVEICRDSFPNAALRAYVFDNFDNGDYFLDEDECAGAKAIQLSYRDVDDLTGIENFPNLQVLECEHGFDNDGRLTAVDLSHNTELEVLNLTGNPGLMALDVTMLPKLRELCVGYTGLSTLNVTENALLEKLLVNNCSFTSLNLSGNEQLKELDCCFNEGLTALDITGNPKLVKLYRLGGRTPDWCPPFIAASLIGYTGGDGQLVLNRDVTVNAGNVVCLASLTAQDISRYETQRVEGVYEQTNYNGEVIGTISFRRVNCDPDKVTLTMSDGVSFTGSLWDVADWVRDEYDLEADAWWSSDETPYSRWSSGEHPAYAAIGGLRADFTVEVLSNPIWSASLSGSLERYEFYRERQGGYESENGYVEQEWSRINCWPGSDENITLCIELRDGRDFSGTIDEVWNCMYRAGYGALMGWHSDETPEDPWSSGETHTAWLDVGEQSLSFEVTVLADPVVSLTVDPARSSIERYSFDREERWGYEKEDGGWVEGRWMTLNAWPGDDRSLFVTAVVGEETYSGTADQVVAAMEADGWDYQLHLSWETDESPESLWEAGETHTAALTLGGQRADFELRVQANPITKLSVNGALTRYLGGKTQRVNGYEYYDEAEGRLAWRAFEEDYDRLDVNPAELPMSFVTNEWIEDEDEPDGGHYRTIDGENLGDLCRKLKEAYGVELNCHWESDDRPEKPWNEEDDYTAWQIIGPFVGTYTVHVEECPITEVELEPIVRYSYDVCEAWGYGDDYGNWYNESYSRIDCHPRGAEISVSIVGEEEPLTGSFDEVEKTLSKRFGDVYWESDQSPLNPWETGMHTAQLVIGGVAWDYDVEVREDPVVSVSIRYSGDGIERYACDRERQDGYESGSGWVEQTWYRVNAWPRAEDDFTVSVTLENGEEYSGTADEVRDALEKDGYENMLGWHSGETPQNLWEGGSSYTAWLDVGGMDVQYQVSVLENPITSLEVETVYHTLGVAAQWDPELEDWVTPEENEYIDCQPDVIRATAVKDGMTLPFEGDEGAFHGWLRTNFGIDPGMNHTFIDPPETWETNRGYQARFTLGPKDAAFMAADYTVTLFENPIRGIRIDEQSFNWDDRVEDWTYRVPGNGPFGGFWVPSDEAWMRLNAMPDITVTLRDGTTDTGRADEVFKRLNANMAQPALHGTLVIDETPTELWYGGEHEAIFAIGTVGYAFPLTVNGPIESVSVEDVTRPVNRLSGWTAWYEEETDSWHYDEEKPWRIEASPETLTITLAEGDYTFSNGTRTMCFADSEEGGCLEQAAAELTRALALPFTLRWNSNETPSARWQVGTDGDAWVEIVGIPVGEDAHYTVTVVNAVTRVALLADGPVDDGGYNQAGFDAARAFCEENELDFDWFTPEGDWEPNELVQYALDLGNNVIVAVGFLFSSAVAELAPDYPEARFILLDDVPTDEEQGQIPGNAVGVTYREEQAGYMAGYAAVKLGYRQLGFLGGMATDSVMRYGIGFVQGARDAAAELHVDDYSIKYGYTGTFWNEYWIRDAMSDWYAGGTELVFACGGGIWESVAAAAEYDNGKIIGVDVDQAAEIDSMYGEGMTVTSAMKGIGASVTVQLNALLDHNFAGGTAVNLGIVSANPEENGVQLAPSTQFSEGFTEDDYAALVAGLLNGTPVSNDTTLSPGDFAPGHVTLCHFQQEVVEEGGE